MKKKYKQLSLQVTASMDRSVLGQMSAWKTVPWTKVPWTKVPWTTVSLDYGPLDNRCNTNLTIVQSELLTEKWVGGTAASLYSWQLD